MAVQRHSNFDISVATIADRNALTKLINGMQVHVVDAIADIMVGDGSATYRWEDSSQSWQLTYKSTNQSLSFKTDEILITLGSVQATNIPADNSIWEIGVVQGDIVIAHPRLEDLTIINGNILGLGAFDGNKLRFTYGYGSITAQLATVLATKLDVGAEVDLTAVSTDIIPTTNSTLNLGSATNRFSKIYVDDALLSINTLYLGDTPVLGTDADTIMISADLDQSINVKTTGTGNTSVQSEHEVNISTNGINADIKLTAAGTNSKLRLAGVGGIELSSPTTIQSDLHVAGDVNFSGNVTTSGTSFIVDSTIVKTTDNIIVLNDGEVGTGVTAGTAGIEIDRGAGAAFRLLFDEADDMFKVGAVGGTYETIASQEFVAASNVTADNLAITQFESSLA